MGVYKREDSDKWWLSYRLGGKLYRRAGGSTKRQAEQLLAKIRTDIYNGTHFPEKQEAGLTVGQLRALWLKQAREKRSLAADEQRFEAIVKHFGETMMVRNLRPTDIEAFKTDLLARPTRLGGTTAPATVNRHLALFKTALNLALVNRHLQRSPMLGVKMLSENNKRDRICTDDELAILTQNAEPGLRLAIIIAHHLGMRMGEISALTWSDIDMKDQTVRIRSTTTKTGEGRELPFSSALKHEFEKRPRSLDGRLFRVDCRTWSPSFKRLTKKLGITDLRFHDLRHTAATRWRRSGMDPFTMASMTGHKDLSTLRRYQTITIEDKRKALALAQET